MQVFCFAEYDNELNKAKDTFNKYNISKQKLVLLYPNVLAVKDERGVDCFNCYDKNSNIKYCFSGDHLKTIYIYNKLSKEISIIILKGDKIFTYMESVLDEYSDLDDKKTIEIFKKNKKIDILFFETGNPYELLKYDKGKLLFHVVWDKIGNKKQINNDKSFIEKQAEEANIGRVENKSILIKEANIEYDNVYDFYKKISLFLENKRIRVVLFYDRNIVDNKGVIKYQNATIEKVIEEIKNNFLNYEIKKSENIFGLYYIVPKGEYESLNGVLNFKIKKDFLVEFSKKRLIKFADSQYYSNEIDVGKLLGELLKRKEYVEKGLNLRYEYIRWYKDDIHSTLSRYVESLPNDVDLKYLTGDLTADGNPIVRTVCIIKEKTGEYVVKLEEIKGPK